jgi:catechol 2,3-dioxygenase-like lactoylglutathione lyase family enzyme
MIGYVTLGTNDLERAGEFYDALAAELGASRILARARFISWGAGSAGPRLTLTKPFDRAPASVGNGAMVALAARDRAQVDRVYALAVSMGGRDEGPPGDRGGGFYAAYFRDPDGNKLNVYTTNATGGS